MTSCTGKNIGTIYGDWLTTTNNGQGLSTTLKNLQDGLGNNSSIQIASNSINFNRNGGSTFLLDGEALTASAAALNAAGAGSCPPTATYILQTPNGLLGNAQALSALSSGILKSATGTGVVSIATEGTDYYSPGNPTTIIDTAGTLDNLFVGNNCGNFAVTGVNNAFYGIGVGPTFGDGSDNSIFGCFAAINIESASSVCIFGNNAGEDITTASEICLFGYSCGSSITTGDLYLCSFGFESAINLTTAIKCSFFGYQSGSEVTDGDQNSFFGYSSGTKVTTGDSNSFFGTIAGFNVTTSSGTSAFGAGSAASQQLYTNCLFLGALSDASVNNLTNAVAIGVNSSIALSNSMNLGNGCKVGINNSSPVYTLDIATVGGISAIQLQDSATPSTPSGNNGVLYVSGGNLFFLNNSGVPVQLN